MLPFLGRKKHNSKVPSHIAIIMDGNARWAKRRGIPTKAGHKSGSENLQKVAQDCIDLGIKFLTVYAFSSENWNRPLEEVNYLMNLLEEYLDKQTNELAKKGVKIVVSGNLEKVSDSLKKKILQIVENSKDNQSLTLNVAFSYGARQEIVDAVRKISSDVLAQKIQPSEIDEKMFTNNLYHPEIPDPDLMIRTAGDCRISNFLLWQSAYTEFYFTEVFWPDFTKKHLVAAIESFNKRERRYGKR